MLQSSQIAAWRQCCRAGGMLDKFAFWWALGLCLGSTVWRATEARPQHLPSALHRQLLDTGQEGFSWEWFVPSSQVGSAQPCCRSGEVGCPVCCMHLVTLTWPAALVTPIDCRGVCLQASLPAAGVLAATAEPLQAPITANQGAPIIIDRCSFRLGRWCVSGVPGRGVRSPTLKFIGWGSPHSRKQTAALSQRLNLHKLFQRV